MFLIDLENLIEGGPRAVASRHADAIQRFQEVARPSQRDHLIVGVNPALMLVAFTAFPSGRVVVGGGKDGADHAILHTIDPIESCATLYYRLVIASGDGIFADAAARFAHLGLRVDVVARGGTVSRALATAAHGVQYLSENYESGGEAWTS